MWQFLENLSGNAQGDVTDLRGRMFDDSMPELDAYPTSRQWACFHKMQLAFLLGDYDKAEKESARCQPLIETSYGAVDLAT